MHLNVTNRVSELCDYSIVTRLPKYQSQDRTQVLHLQRIYSRCDTKVFPIKRGDKLDTGEILKAALQNAENLCSLCLWRQK